MDFGSIEGRLFLAGAWARGDGKRLEVVDPVLEEPFSMVDTASVEQIDRAVNRAVEAQRELRATTGSNRGGWLRTIAARLTGVRDSMARLESRSVGKPLAEARLDVDDAVGCLLHYADLAAALDTEQNRVIAEPSADFEIRVRYEPVGVSALIIPWNFPLLTTLWKLAPAVAAGCACIVKPSEHTPLSALALASLVADCGLPPGAFSVLNGDGAKVGEPLCRSAGIAKISFTGSTATGQKVAAIAAADYKRLTVEAGGKSPIIVFADTPIDEAVEWIMFGALYNQGEVCNATTRIIVEESVYPAITTKLLHEVSRLVIGPPDEPTVQMGPLQNRPQFEKFLRYVAQGQADGDRLLYGGDRHPAYPRGFFVRPALFESASSTSVIWREEVFGPLLVLRSFSTETEALRLANDSQYGLAAAVLTADRLRADRVAANLEAGCIWQNCSGPAFVQGPWGGFKRSGIGRELGRWGLESFQEVKQVTRYRSARPWGWYLK
jgi:betaine-aldehyde dehydrogenase